MKKLVWFLVLLVVVISIIFVCGNLNLNVKVTSDINYSDNFNNYAFGDEPLDEFFNQASLAFSCVVSIELVVSIYAIIFMLLPLSKILGKKNYKKWFTILLLLRILMLIIGNIIVPLSTILVDFLSIFVGVFLILPICYAYIRKSKVKGNSKQDNESCKI